MSQLPTDVQAKIDQYLDAIDRTLEGAGVPRNQRIPITEEVHGQILDMVSAKSDHEPTVQAIEAILSKLDPPEAYKHRGSGLVKGSSADASRPEALARRSGLGSLLLSAGALAGVLVLIVMGLEEAGPLNLTTRRALAISSAAFLIIGFGLGSLGFKSIQAKIAMILCLLTLVAGAYSLQDRSLLLPMDPPLTPTLVIDQPDRASLDEASGEGSRGDRTEISFVKYRDLLNSGEFSLSRNALNLSANHPSFTTMLKGPVNRVLKAQRYSRFVRILVPMAPGDLARADLLQELTGQISAGDIELKPEFSEVLGAKEIPLEEYLRLVRSEGVAAFALLGPELGEHGTAHPGSQLYALIIRPNGPQPKLRWVKSSVSTDPTLKPTKMEELANGLAEWRFREWRGYDTEDAVSGSLKWLSWHQADDGSWCVLDHVKQCIQPATCITASGCRAMDVGVTSVSLLCFLGAGYTHMSKDTYDGVTFGNVVENGLRHLMERQQEDGWIGKASGIRSGHISHALATLALVSAADLTEVEDFEQAAIRGARALEMRQNSDGGWGDIEGRSDGFATGMTLLTLSIAGDSGVAVSPAVLEKGLSYLDRLQDPGSGRVGYRYPGIDGPIMKGVNEQYASHPATSAFQAILARDPDRRRQALDVLRLHTLNWPQRWKEDSTQNDYIFLFLTTIAFYRHDGPSGPFWDDWKEPLKSFLLKAQSNHPEARGCSNTSWAPVDKWGCVGGRVYSTAINTLSMQIYYRYANAFGTK